MSNRADSNEGKTAMRRIQRTWRWPCIFNETAAKQLKQAAIASMIVATLVQSASAAGGEPGINASTAARLEALEAKVEYLNDHQQITGLLTRFFRGVNRHDVDLMRSVFWPGAQINRGGGQYGTEQFLKILLESREDGYDSDYAAHQHHVTNNSVEIDGDVAHIESYVVAFWRNKDGKTTRIGGVRYLNKVERRGGEWRIAVHEVIPTFWIETNSIFDTVFKDFPSSGCAMGADDRRDPSYQRPLNRPKDAILTGAICAK